jgi:hypothetical protein
VRSLAPHPCLCVGLENARFRRMCMLRGADAARCLVPFLHPLGCVPRIIPAQINAVLGDACLVKPVAFGVGDVNSGESEALRVQACRQFMGGLLTGGEFAATSYFQQLARVEAKRMLRLQGQPPAVSEASPAATAAVNAKGVGVGNERGK